VEQERCTAPSDAVASLLLQAPPPKAKQASRAKGKAKKRVAAAAAKGLLLSDITPVRDTCPKA